jgi:hypothetical protein
VRRPFVLARLAGAQPDLLEQAPGEQVRAAAMGGVLLTTAGVAGISAAFALNTAVRLPPVPSVVVGALWAWVIFNLDRMLVVSMTRQGGWRRNVLTAVPRVLLAILIGAVISVPLVLRIFQPEINDELQTMRNERAVASKAELDERFKQIPDLEKQVVDLQATAVGGARSDVASDQGVSRLQAAYDAKTAEYDKAEQDVVCENDGTCGSGQVGRGPSYREKVEIRDRLAGERTALKTQLDEATTAAQKRIDAGAEKAATTATSELGRVQAELAKQRQDRADAEAKGAAAANQRDGLLARLAALDRLSGRNPTLWTANIALGLLFMAIELLPVLVKLLTTFGPKTHYDRLVGRQESELADAFDNQVDLRRKRAGLDDDAFLQIAQHRAALQVDQGKELNDRVVDKQSKIAQKAVDTWAVIAAARSDDELRRWYAQQTGGQPAPSAVAAPVATASSGAPTSPGQTVIPPPPSPPAAPTPPQQQAGAQQVTVPLPRPGGSPPQQGPPSSPAVSPAVPPKPATPGAVPAAAAVPGQASGYRQFKAMVAAHATVPPSSNNHHHDPSGS